MEIKCEVIGWLLSDEDSAQVLIRDENGNVLQQTADLHGALGECAIQTGSFRRGSAIIDPVTQQTLGYEMERISNPFAV